MLAAALFHDVCEGCGTTPEGPPFSAPAKAAAALLTKAPERFLEVGCDAALAEYYSGIQGNQTAMFVKVLDRFSNRSTCGCCAVTALGIFFEGGLLLHNRSNKRKSVA